MKRNKLSDGLAALALTAGLSCGDTYNNASYYGPNGEEIGDFSGSACDSPLRGKYLVDIQGCEHGTIKPISDNCIGGFHSYGVLEPYLVVTVSGLNLKGSFYRHDGTFVEINHDLIRPTASDLEQPRGPIAPWFCLLANNPDLYFFKPKNGELRPPPTIFQVRDAPFENNQMDCQNNVKQQPWYQACR